MESVKMIYYVVPIFIILFFSILYSSFKDSSDVNDFNLSSSIYDYELLSIEGDTISMSEFKNKKILIVNVASKCGYTYQYSGLQDLYDKYKDELVVLGFPSNDFLWQEPGKNSQIKTFCSTKYGVEFPMFSKISVKKGKNQNSLYTWLSNKNLNGWNDAAPSWNFYKYLINDKGDLIEIFSSKIKPTDDKILKYFNTKTSLE
tara:strand:+ start:4678 stop:5283 length:606 start_codon:yes stop_codon:yes gene_type:complete